MDSTKAIRYRGVRNKMRLRLWRRLTTKRCGPGRHPKMVAVDLKSVVSRLSDTGRRQLEAAAGLTLSRSHYNVEIEHFLLKLVETQGSDVATILRKQGIDAGQAAAQLNRALDKLRSGNARAPALSPDIVSWLREAWLIASLEAGATHIRSGHMLAALLADETLSRTMRESCPALSAVPVDAVRKNLADVAAGSDEANQAEAAPGGGTAGTTAA
ncbi:MAG: hypothetical protein H7Z19_08425, partial [Chitinophagaceae bacterium]|nr:hypothetical protein [Rubrivivax sp.]